MRITIAILPDELLMTIMLKLNVRDVAHCSRVSRRWHKVAESQHLWHELAVRDYPQDVARQEAEEKQEKETTQEAEESLSAKADKIVFDTAASSALTFSNDNKTAKHKGESCTHCNVPVATGYSSGVHRWRVRIDGLDGDMWTAVGTTLDPSKSFSYDLDAGFVGYSSAHNIFYHDRAYQLDGYSFANGDIIAVELDCDKRTLLISKNGDPLPTLTVQPDVTLYPWFNLYQPGSSITLIDDEQEEEEKGLVFDEATCHELEFEATPVLRFSKDKRLVTHHGESATHRNACILTGFPTGRHSWTVKLDGLSGNMWTAVGTTLNPRALFSYGADTGFVGYSSAKVIFYKDKACTYEGYEFQNGDILHVTLNCNTHTLQIFRNGIPLTPLPVQSGVTLYPWINLFQPGSSVALLSSSDSQSDTSAPEVEEKETEKELPSSEDDSFMFDTVASDSQLEFSDGGRTAKHTGDNNTHCNAVATSGWTTGKHTWHVKLAGLDNHYWTAIGTTINPKTDFTYTAGAGFVGYSSARNVFFADKEGDRNETPFDNGDIISVTLDCDVRTLSIRKNGIPLPVLKVQPGVKLYPWFNLYQSGSSISLLDHYEGGWVEELKEGEDLKMRFDSTYYQKQEYKAEPALVFSEDLTKVTHVSPDRTHRNATVSKGFSSGIHIWHVKLEGLVDHMWTAVGTTTDLTKQFNYDTNSGFVGYSSCQNIFYRSKAYELKGPLFDNGDVISVKVDCDKGILQMYRNGAPLPSLEIQSAVTQYPWFNLYHPGSSVTLLDEYDQPLLDPPPLKPAPPGTLEHFTFDTELSQKANGDNLVFSSSKRAARHAESSTHSNACVSVGWETGRHTWHVKLDGLDDHFWTGIGTTIDPAKDFSYATGGGFVGYSSHKNVFHSTKEHESEDRTWDNGDIITVTLDCDAHTLDIARNGQPMPTLEVQSGVKIYPWINVYQGKSTVVLVDDPDHPDTEPLDFPPEKAPIKEEEVLIPVIEDDDNEDNRKPVTFDQEATSKNITFSEDGTVATLADGSHTNIVSSVGFTAGQHSWAVKLDGLSNNYWAGIGTTIDPQKPFSYDKESGFVGYSSADNVFVYDESDNHISGYRFDNGDIISLHLDCNKHVLQISQNGVDLAPLKVQSDMPLFPWFNLYEPGSSITLLKPSDVPKQQNTPSSKKRDYGTEEHITFDSQLATELTGEKLTFSPDNRSAFHGAGSTHCNACVTDGWQTGRHTWHVKLSGLSNNFWTGLGVTTNPNNSFSYSAGAGFIGYSSHRNTFYATEEPGEQDMVWDNDDIITVTLDCDTHTLEMFRNGIPMPVLSVPAGVTLYPWFNLYQGNSSVTLLDSVNFDEEKEATSTTTTTTISPIAGEAIIFDRALTPTNVTFSDDGKVATLSDGSHTNVVVSQGFSSGKHVWHVRLAGLSGNYWTAIGTTLDPEKSFTYSKGAGFVGHSSAKNIFYATEDYTLTGINFDNSDVITVELDCDEHLLTLSKNGVELAPLTVQSGVTLYPWFNLYQPGSSITLLDEYGPPVKKKRPITEAGKFLFDELTTPSNVQISEDGKTAKLTDGSHTNVRVTSEGFTSGKHAWHVRLDGLSYNMWTAIGITKDPSTNFTYDTGAGFIGFSSSHNIFYRDRKYELTGGAWENGDVISLVLDCDQHLLEMFRNGNPIEPVMEIHYGVPNHPWFNLYQPGSSITLLDDYDIELKSAANEPDHIPDPSSEALTFDENLVKEKEIAEESLLEFTDECKRVTHKQTTNTHRNASVSKGFSNGVHKWHCRVDGLVEHFWVAVGVTTDPGKHFTYETGAGFVGASSVGNIFHMDKPYESDKEQWENEDVLSLILDCDEHTLEIQRNEEPLVKLPVQDCTLYPWFNVYQGGASITLLDTLKEPGTVFFDEKFYADNFNSSGLKFSHDGRRVTNAFLSRSHQNVPINTGWRHGKHTWHMQLEGLASNMWTAIGTSLSPHSEFSYSKGAGFVGYSSAKNIFFKDKEYTLHGVSFNNGDVISVTLDCDAHTLDISRNGEALPTLSVQHGVKLYPWVNLYQPRSSVTILDRYTPPTDAKPISIEGFDVKPSPALSLDDEEDMGGLFGDVDPVVVEDSSPFIIAPPEPEPQPQPQEVPKPKILSTPSSGDWKALYAHFATMDDFCFDVEVYTREEYMASPLLKFSEDRKMATHIHTTTLHRNAPVSTGWTRGVHRWHVRLDGLSGHMWTAIGTTIDPAKSFSYDVDAGFAGYSSANNIFYPHTKYELTGGVFENGDVISVTLDCDKHTLDISRNGVPLPTLAVQKDVRIYPWFNLYQPGSSVTLLRSYQPGAKEN